MSLWHNIGVSAFKWQYTLFFLQCLFPLPLPPAHGEPWDLPWDLPLHLPHQVLGGWKREKDVRWHRHIATIYTVWNVLCDRNQVAQLGNARTKLSKTKLPLCPSNTYSESRVGFVWQNLHPFSMKPFCTPGHHSASTGRPLSHGRIAVG